MSISQWFRLWVLAFLNLFTFDSKKRKSKEQRKREQERRLKSKRSFSNFYRVKKERRRRRNGNRVRYERLTKAIFGFLAATLAVVFLPFGLIDWARKSARVKKAAGKIAKQSSGTASRAEMKSKSLTTGRDEPSAALSAVATRGSSAADIREMITHEPTPPSVDTPVLNIEPRSASETDEGAPKSTSKNKGDRYIRKRMIIAGSHYCDKIALDSLEVGTCFDLEAEPENPYDKDAVRLVYRGYKIGYVPKQDSLAFATCLKLGRTVYGVITAIIEDNGRTKYEFETWFDSEK